MTDLVQRVSINAGRRRRRWRCRADFAAADVGVFEELGLAHQVGFDAGR